MTGSGVTILFKKIVKEVKVGKGSNAFAIMQVKNDSRVFPLLRESGKKKN